MNMCSTSVTARAMPIKTKLTYHLTPDTMATNKDKRIINISKVTQKETLHMIGREENQDRHN